ncbi:MAG: hypothetical protein WBL25_14120 [Anaerolineales bacterium]
MKLVSRFLLILALLGLLLPLLNIGNVYAKGAPAKITIKGPGISGVLEITDKQLLEPFGWGEFADFSTQIAAGINTEGGYIITRYVLMGGTTMRSLDTFTYFPGSGEEESIVYYKGIIDKKFIYGGSPHDGKWFLVSAAGGSAIQRIFDAHGIFTEEISPLYSSIPVNIRVWMRYGFVLVIAAVSIFLFVQRKRLFL